MRPVITEITRGINDSSFSMDELFYRYFNEMPLLFFQAGTTDLYDCPQVFSNEDEEDLEDPRNGPQELEKAINVLFDFLKTKKVKDGTDRTNVVVAKFCNFSTNVFAGYVIFETHNVIVQLRITPGKRENMTSISVIGIDEKQPIWAILLEHCKTYIRPARIRKDEINIITMSEGEFFLKSIPLVNHNQEFSYDFYNDDFKPVSERVVQALQSLNDCGLVLLHGNPGTGKTSYLKYLLHTITKKKLIYLPPDLIESLSAPNFISFLLSEASNSILLIEDAENVLRHREAGGNQAVSNILNISDGILGDVLRLQIVCTFNSKLSDIDNALLRPGRLIAEYRFEKLSSDKTTALMNKLYSEVLLHKEMTLAEIFNFKKMPDKTNRPERVFGFKPPTD